MPHNAKRKRTTQVENEFLQIIHQFYLRLFVYLMIPAMLLGLIFGLPVLVLNNLPDRLNAQCRTIEGDYGVRIISETQHNSITTYYWTDNAGESWHIVKTVERPYQSAVADCQTITLEANSAIITTSAWQLRIAPDGEIIDESQ